MPTCRHCGGLFAAGDRFCPKCGTPTTQQESEAPTSEGSSWESRVLDLMRAGQKIEAIKIYRTETGAGLKEAKDAVEALARQHGIPVSSGCGGAAAVLVASLTLFALASAVLISFVL